MKKTFIEKYLANEILGPRIHIENLIEGDVNSNIHEELGFTQSEYQRYLRDSSYLDKILAKYKFGKFVEVITNDIFSRPQMFGIHNESLEMQIVALLESWVFVITQEYANRFVLDLVQAEISKRFPKAGALYLSQIIADKSFFVVVLKEITSATIEKIKKL